MNSIRLPLDANFASDPRVKILACDSHRCPSSWSGGLDTVGFQLTALNRCSNRWSAEARVFCGSWPGEVCGLGFVRSSRATFALHGHTMRDYRSEAHAADREFQCPRSHVIRNSRNRSLTIRDGLHLCVSLKALRRLAPLAKSYL